MFTHVHDFLFLFTKYVKRKVYKIQNGSVSVSFPFIIFLFENISLCDNFKKLLPLFIIMAQYLCFPTLARDLAEKCYYE